MIAAAPGDKYMQRLRDAGLLPAVPTDSTAAAPMIAAAPAAELSLKAVTLRPAELPVPLVRVTLPSLPTVAAPAQVAPALPTCLPLDSVLNGRTLARGPLKLLKLLHEVAVSTVAARAYPVTPSQVTIHQSQELVAAALGCSLRSVYNWTQALQLVGLLESRAHFTTSQGVTRIDGTLYAVALKPRHVSHLPHDDLKHSWRDLDSDRAAGRTAWKILAGSDQKQEAEGWRAVLAAWAVTPGSSNVTPLLTDPANSPSTVQDVAYMLPLLATAHPSKRPGMVGLMASTLARCLGDVHSHRWHCSRIWKAWREELEGRGGLQKLGAQLARLEVDRREWLELKNPGALLASRLTA